VSRGGSSVPASASPSRPCTAATVAAERHSLARVSACSTLLADRSTSKLSRGRAGWGHYDRSRGRMPGRPTACHKRLTRAFPPQKLVETTAVTRRSAWHHGPVPRNWHLERYPGKYVAIDVSTDEFVLDADTPAAPRDDSEEGRP
jgi:hypothetical protein